MRVGGNKIISVDVRIVAATNESLEEKVRDGSFRRDLYYRLNVLSLQIPTLRERQEDIPILTDYFIRKYQPAGKAQIRGVTDEVMRLFLEYPWPGNIRELENTVERACLLTTDVYIRPEHITASVLRYRAPAAPAPAVNEPARGTIHDAERELILKQLNESRGNVKNAAARLGISRRTLYRKMQKLEIDYQHLRRRE